MILADETEETRELCSSLVEMGFACRVAPDGLDVREKVADFAPMAMLVHTQRASGGREVSAQAVKIKEEWRVPVIALLSVDMLDGLEFSPAVDDFVVSPWDAAEVALRADRAVARIRSAENRGRQIECGDLAIDVDNCEVTVDGRPIALTFREYELLKFLASNRGRVFSREDLLSQVWGYDYFGGGRTVDVHVSRLRSKIEDPGHTFVETVRNVGYRFRKE
jgi:DNA-binding response OmpR family regulator